MTDSEDTEDLEPQASDAEALLWPGRSGRVDRGRLALLLAQGRTQREAAKELNISEKTVHRYLQDADFRVELDRERARIRTEDLAPMRALRQEAFLTLRKGLESPDERIAQAAARFVLTLDSKHNWEMRRIALEDLDTDQ